MTIFAAARRVACEVDAFVTGPFDRATHRPAVLVSLWLTPVALLATIMVLFTVNMPEGDDVPMLVRFSLGYSTAAWPFGKLGALMTPYNEHYVLFQRGAVILNLLFTGSVNFNAMKWVGVIALLGMLPLLWSAAGRMENKALLLAPVPLLLLNAQQWVNYVSVVDALTWNSVMVLGFGSLLLLAQSWPAPGGDAADVPPRIRPGLFCPATLLALFCALTLVGGLAALVTGAALLCLQRRWKAAGLWFALAGGIVVLVGQRGMSTPFSELAAFAFTHPVDFVLLFCYLCGSIARIGAQTVTAGLFGALLLFGAVRLIILGAPRVTDEEAPPRVALRLFAAYILLFAGSIALGRLAHGGPMQGLQYRYAILSGVLACVVYAAYAPSLFRRFRRFLPYVLLIALLMNAGGYVSKLGRFQTRLDSLTEDSARLRDALATPGAPVPTGIDPAVMEMARKGLFRP
ncbi:MAG: hypothetical protein AB7E47_07175 [Desulfovibrionaceae bacterium]